MLTDEYKKRLVEIMSQQTPHACKEDHEEWAGEVAELIRKVSLSWNGSGIDAHSVYGVCTALQFVVAAQLMLEIHGHKVELPKL